MLILLRKTWLKNGNIVEQSDSELRLEQITIGSDNHCDMQLFGEHIAPQHAELDFPSQDQLRIRCRPQCDVSIDGQAHSEAELKIGQWAEFDQHRVAIITAPPGFDAALELQIDHDSQQSLQLRYQQDIALKLPSNRRNSYMLAALILLATLLIPLLGYLQPETGIQLRKLGAPSDALWSSGPLSGPHHLLDRAEDCNSCHLKGFEQVPDSACINCHKDTHQHLP
ncbi:MAG: FHA domain-containing protein, partial [Spongiibacteraceae bacterium]